MATGWGRPPAEPAPHDRRLVCLELQTAAAAGWAGSSGLAAMLGNCRALLAVARGAGWSVAHVHRRGQACGRGLAVDRPLSGLEPLPSEAVFLRDAELSARRHPLAAAPWPGARGETLVIGFINDHGAAEAFALAPGGAAPVADALGGGYARQVVERARHVARADRLIAPGSALRLPPDWPHPANAP